MATETDTSAAARIASGAQPAVERNNRRTRWYHAGVYLLVLLLLATGWWLLAGREGQPSPLASLTGKSDTDLHQYLGWAFLGLAVVGAALGWRAAATLLGDSVRFRRSDLRWFARWPLALLTGHFPRHEGHFDPGQRIMNLVVLGLLLVLVGTGVGLTQVVGGPAFGWLDRLHKWATYVVTPVLLGHILVASGVLPGYRGAWRAMHLGGRLPARVARRLWPGWLDRQDERDRPAAHPPQSTPWPPWCPYRISIASYVLGALPPAERRELDAHLRTCPECRDELVGLAGLPGLLARLRRRWRRAAGLGPQP